jgi:hypothetical protein
MAQSDQIGVPWRGPVASPGHATIGPPSPKPNWGPIWMTEVLFANKTQPSLTSGQGIEPRKPEEIPQGKHTSLMQPQPLAGIHPFSSTLQEWERGIPVD